jgi:hypothetical protein
MLDLHRVPGLQSGAIKARGIGGEPMNACDKCAPLLAEVTKERDAGISRLADAQSQLNTAIARAEAAEKAREAAIGMQRETACEACGAKANICNGCVSDLRKRAEKVSRDADDVADVAERATSLSDELIRDLRRTEGERNELRRVLARLLPAVKP